MGNYQPKTGDVVTVYLPDEMTRATIVRLVSKTAGIVELLHFTTAKTHGYRKGSLVPCQFGRTPMGVMGWNAVDEDALARAARPEEVVPEESVVREATHADIFGQAERKSKGKASAASAR